MATLNWVKDNIAVLQFVVIVLGGGWGLYQYWHAQTESRRVAARQMAIQHLVVDGFFVAASEVERVGYQVVCAWTSANSLRKHKDPVSDFEAWRKELLQSEHCRLILYGTNAHLAEAMCRVRTVHGVFNYAIINSYAGLRDGVRILASEPADLFLRKSETEMYLYQNYYMFAGGVAAKAAEVLIDDENLTFSTRHILRNKRLVTLIGLCEQFREKHKAYVDAYQAQSDEQATNKRLMELNDWMNWAIEKGLNPI